MNRLSRDEVIHAGLDLADKPSLDEHDRPGGVVLENAHAVGWLQRGLDLAHRLYPFAGALARQIITLQTGVDTYTLATDFNVDVRDGMTVTDAQITQRAFRSSLENLLNYQISSGVNPPTRRSPVGYIISPPAVFVYPTPDRAYTATLWYYKMPSVMSHGAIIPTFPDDNVLVKYLYWEALEWSKMAEPGTAEKYLTTAIGMLQQAGHGREPVRVDIPLDPHVIRQGSMARPDQGYDWMGATTIG